MPKLSVDQFVEDDSYTARDFFTWDLPLALIFGPLFLVAYTLAIPGAVVRWARRRRAA